MADSPRDKAAASRGRQQRAQQRRRAVIVISVVVALAAVGGVIAAIAVNQPSHTKPITGNRALAPSTVVDPIRNVSASTLDSVGIGTVMSGAARVTGPPLTNGGKPELLYIGAEFCPLCAGERWGMAVALSRFGTLNGIRMTKSASNDNYPNTSTLDFWHTTYDSKYLAFTPVESEDRDRKKLEPVTSAQNALWASYAKQLRVTQGYPFLDFANRYVVPSVQYDPGVLKGLTQEQIAAKLANPADPVAKGIDGTANVLTAVICGVTNNQPASVCSDRLISSIQAQLNKPASSGG